jgi:protein Tex
VHISAMANTYVTDPRKIATPGDVVRVKVLEVAAKRRRISLTMRLDDIPRDRATAARPVIAPPGSEKPADTRASGSNLAPADGGGMAEAFRRAGLTGKAPERR